MQLLQKSKMMSEKLPCVNCFALSAKPEKCQAPCLLNACRLIVDQIVQSVEQVTALIQRKLPDPPIQLVHSKEVCSYVGIVAKTLYRCEKQGMILAYKKDHTGKYFLHADMVLFKKKYHNLSDF